MTEEQRSDAPQIRGFTTEGKPVGALARQITLAHLAELEWSSRIASAGIHCTAG
jgi:hypothetical protein